MGKGAVGAPRDALGLETCHRMLLFPHWVLSLPFAWMDWGLSGILMPAKAGFPLRGARSEARGSPHSGLVGPL